MSEFTANFRHLVTNALRAGGYEDDAQYVVHATLLSVTRTTPAQLKFLVHMDSDCDIPHAIIYLQGSATGEWVADY